MIIYIHGFSSSGRGTKAEMMRSYCKERNIGFMAPSLSYVPDLAIETLYDIIVSQTESVSLVGSSLGGYYALYLAQKYKLKVTLINPSIYPYKTLASYTGMVTNFYDGSHFEWSDGHIEMLKKYEVEASNNSVLLLLQKGDTLLDYRQALEKLPHAEAIVEEGGDHGFVGIERHFKKIVDFSTNNL